MYKPDRTDKIRSYILSFYAKHMNSPTIVYRVPWRSLSNDLKYDILHNRWYDFILHKWR